MKRLPLVGPDPSAAPHVVILGAGASRAACPTGDRHGRVLPVMADLVEVVGLGDLLADSGLGTEATDFEAVYDTLVSSPQHQASARQLERRIREYFAALELPDRPTAYDYLLLGLRPKDLVATFNWDPLLTQAYARNRDAASLPQLVFLHGAAGLGYCLDHRRYGPVGEPCDTCGSALSETPLLYPVRDKDYTGSPFIARQWDNLKYMLKRAYFLTIFGYSAPRTDVAARSTLLQVWQHNEARELAEVEIINTKSESELRASWDEFITRVHYGVLPSINRSHISRFPRRSCEGLFMATLMNSPWRDNWYPALGSVTELQKWIHPLVEEEQGLGGQGKFSGHPCPGPGHQASSDDR